MKYCRVRTPEGPSFALVESVAGRDSITRLLGEVAEGALPGDARGSRAIDPVPLDAAQTREAPLQLLSPVRPSKIVCVGRNYRDHARELGNEAPADILIFLKPPSSLLPPGGAIVLPRASARVDHEAELGVVIGRTCRRLSDEQEARHFIRGFTCVNDVTARDLQNKDGQWTRAKGFDTFCPAGPVVADKLDFARGVEVRCEVNGQLRQLGNTRDFLFSLDAIIRYISRVMTLLPGDLIATGTPAGVGPLAAGDVVEVTVDGVGTLRNAVTAE
jgi:2-keto-4-pentenoate hydratase/2-oxohepta-3-ene-1,7-dioic acid hydratase in catechol pathway